MSWFVGVLQRDPEQPLPEALSVSLPSAPTRAKFSAASIKSTTELTEDTEEDVDFRVFSVFRGPRVEPHRVSQVSDGYWPQEDTNGCNHWYAV